MSLLRSFLGMFLFAKLVTWNLLHQTDRQGFEFEIESIIFPKDLDKA